MGTLYDVVMTMERLMASYESFLKELDSYMKEKGIDADDKIQAIAKIYSDAQRNYERLLSTKRMEDLLRMEGEYKIMKAFAAEIEAGAWTDVNKLGRAI